MKIVFIIDSLRRHGAQGHLLHLVRGLSQLGYEQRVVKLNRIADADVEQAIASAGCTVEGIGKWQIACLVGWWRLVQILKAAKPDVVMTMLDFSDTLGRPAARMAGCKIIVSAIQVRNRDKPLWRRWLDRRTIHWANRVIFNSHEIVSYGCECDGVADQQVVVIANGIEDISNRGLALRGARRNQLGITTETVLLGAMGRLARQKNYELLIQIAAKLPTDRKWKVLILGDGPERTRLVALGHRLRLDDRLIWLGARADVEGWLAAMDIFVHTADYEGMPNAVMEAMVMGLPVVASNVDGTREIVRHGVTGYLVPAGDAERFVVHLRALLDDATDRTLVGRQAHKDVLARFSLEQMIGDYDRLFQSLV